MARGLDHGWTLPGLHPAETRRVRWAADALRCLVSHLDVTTFVYTRHGLGSALLRGTTDAGPGVVRRRPAQAAAPSS